jgi:rfaE bifunctional protein nucleotidyltransferase chain/domain
MREALQDDGVKRARDVVIPRRDIAARVGSLRRAGKAGKKVVFTNGCFDLLHPGHVRYLEAARSLGDILIVAINSDASVRRLKGSDRPIVPELERCEVIAALRCVDLVTMFEEDTPYEVIAEILPDVLVKGGDWTPETIVGRDIVEGRGGTVTAIRFEQGFSTTAIIDRIRAR